MSDALTDDHHGWASEFIGFDTRGESGGSPGGRPDETTAEPSSQPADNGNSAGAPAEQPVAVQLGKQITPTDDTGVTTLPEVTVEGDQGAGAEYQHGLQDALAGKPKEKTFAPQYQDSYDAGYADGLQNKKDSDELNKQHGEIRELTEEDRKSAEESAEKQKEAEEILESLFHKHPPHIESPTEEGPPEITPGPGVP